jgi:hypothetical protein
MEDSLLREAFGGAELAKRSLYYQNPQSEFYEHLANEQS